MEKPLKGSLSKKFPYYIGWEAFWCSVGARLRLGPSKHAGFVATAFGARTYRWWGRCEPSWMRKGASLSFPWYSSPPLATQLVPVGNKLENETGRPFHLSLSALAAAGSPFPSLLFWWEQQQVGMQQQLFLLHAHFPFQLFGYMSMLRLLEKIWWPYVCTMHIYDPPSCSTNMIRVKPSEIVNNSS